MIEQKESIAMWGMYAQPWEHGVMVSIPTKAFKAWMKSITKVYRANPITKKIDVSDFVDLSKAKVRGTKVVYCDRNDNGGIRRFKLFRKYNEFVKEDIFPTLAGFVKDDAWSYEKEFRLRIDLDKSTDYKAVAVKIPDDILRTITITTGPRCKMPDALADKFSELAIKESDFTNKLNWVYCDSCKWWKH